METYIILGVLALMVIVMVTDKFEFGFAPVAACVILAALGICTNQEAFAGFTNNYVIITAALLVLSNLIARTHLIGKVQSTVMEMQKGKSGFALYLVLILFVIVMMLFLQPGPACLLVIVVVTNMPSSEKLPNSQMLLPLGTLCDLTAGKVPIGMTLMFIMWINGFLENAGYGAKVGIVQYTLVGLVTLIIALVYSLTAYRILPKFAVTAAEGEENAGKIKFLAKKDERIVYTVFAVSTLAMFFSGQLGDLIYIIPVIGIGILIIFGAITFKEVRGSVSHQLVFMLAGVFALADIMANRGITAMMGSAIQGALGANASGWVVVFVFAFATTLMANMTGSNIGTLMIMAPIAVSTAIAVGCDPRAAAVSVTIAANCSVVMPMDTVMGMIFGRGYRMVDTFKYTIPLNILYVAGGAVAAGIIFPM